MNPGGGPYNSNYDYAGAYQNAVGGYNQAAQATQQQQGNLQNYQANMPNLQNVYQGALTGAQQMYGFNPQDLAKAQKVLAQTQTTLANLPQAVQQQGNYYGTTAGQIANNMAQQGGVLQNVLAGQTNAVGQYQALLGATQAQAQQEQAAQGQYEQLRLGALQNLVANALGFQQQQQGQEGVTQTQMSNYGAYLNALKQSQAAQAAAAAQQTSARASLISAQADAALKNYQLQQLQSFMKAFQNIGYNQNQAQQMAQSLQNAIGNPQQAGTISSLFSNLQGGGGIRLQWTL